MAASVSWFSTMGGSCRIHLKQVQKQANKEIISLVNHIQAHVLSVDHRISCQNIFNTYQ